MTFLFKLVYIVSFVQPQLHVITIKEDLYAEECIAQIELLANHGYTIDKGGVTPLQGGYLCIPKEVKT